MTESQKAISPLLKFENAIRRVLFIIAPNLGKYDKTIYARVLKAKFKGGKVDESNKGFSVDLQPLSKDLSVDDNFEKLVDVPIDSQNFGGGGVVYVVPKKGAIVRLSFMYNDPSFPYVESITSEGETLPEGTADEFRIETADGVVLQIKGSKITIKTENYNVDFETWIDFFFSHSHLGNMGVPTSNVQASVPPILKPQFQTGGL